MKKLNHVWVISDGIKGHEVQSVALAHSIAQCVNIYHCHIKQPWLAFAPKVMPFFNSGLVWKAPAPKLNQSPDAIISCGRRMAAVAKHIKKTTQSCHIQILDPKDNHLNYDLLICPEHDNTNGPNIITMLGSLHQINPISLQKITSQCLRELKLHKPTVTLLLGNPSESFFREVDEWCQQIKKRFQHHHIILCGSRRTPKHHHNTIRKSFKEAHLCWLSEEDGDNPYQCLLAASDVFIVSGDSINMINEVCATDKPVIVIDKFDISNKHHRFIKSIESRLSSLSEPTKKQKPLNCLNTVAQAVLTHIQKH